MKKQTVLFQILILAASLGCWSNTKSKVELNSSHGFLAEERIEFMSENDTLVGYLIKPHHKKPYPVIVVLHSASHGHHDNELYNHLEQNMNELGIGVFTFDRRGSGESSGKFNTASLETLAKDALNAIAQLKKRNDLNKEKSDCLGLAKADGLLHWLIRLTKQILHL